VSAVVSHVAWAYGFRVGSCALGNASTLPLLQPFPSPSYTCVPPLSLARSATLVHAVSSTCVQLAAGLAPECLGNVLGMSWKCLGNVLGQRPRMSCYRMSRSRMSCVKVPTLVVQLFSAQQLAAAPWRQEDYIQPCIFLFFVYK